MTIDASRLEQTIDRFYEAAARPELWRSALHEISVASDALGAQRRYHRPAGAALHTASEGLDEVVEPFHVGWHANSPREPCARRRKMAREEVITDADLFTEDELDREAWRHDFPDRFGLRWFASFAAFPFDQIAPVILTIDRPACRPSFTREEKRLLSAIVPHVYRAGQASLAVAAAAGSGLLEALDRAGHGGLLLDDPGRVVRMNATAELMPDEALQVCAGRLVATSGEDNGRSQRLIDSVTSCQRSPTASVSAALAIARHGRYPLGQVYEVELIRDGRAAEHRRRRPFGQVPTYADEEVAIFESGAIVLRIAERAGKLIPTDPAARIRAIQWLACALDSFESWVMALAVNDVFEADREWSRARHGKVVDDPALPTARSGGGARRPELDRRRYLHRRRPDAGVGTRRPARELDSSTAFPGSPPVLRTARIGPRTARLWPTSSYRMPSRRPPEPANFAHGRGERRWQIPMEARSGTN